MKEKVSRKFGRLALAVLRYIELVGEVSASDSLFSKGRNLGETVRKVRSRPDILSIYNSLKEVEEKSLRTVVWRLKQKGLIRQDGTKLAITEPGRMTVKRSDPVVEKWDGKWRIVFFDIPENWKRKRNWLRRQLYNQEFRMLQESVFVGKQPLSQEAFEGIHIAGIGQCVRMITVGEIDDDSILTP